jgi:hypothetical protein
MKQPRSAAPRSGQVSRRAAWWGAVHSRADVLRAEGERAGVLEYVEAAEEREEHAL